MQKVDPDSRRVIQVAAWMWVVYLVLQSLIDLSIYAGKPGGPVFQYYMYHFSTALVFLILSYSPLMENATRVKVASMILVISLVPILMNPLFNLKLPQAPLSNIEGMILRQVPVLMIALVLVAWHYPLGPLIMYAFTIGLSELAFVVLVSPMQGSRSLSFIFTIIIRTVCFLVVGFFINQLINRLRSQQQSLKLANQQLSHYASTLERLTVSRERNRISRELHDTAVHTLSGLAVQLETARAYWDVDPETSRGQLDQSLQAARSGLQETRRAMSALRSNPLDDLGLRQGLRVLIESAAQRGRFTPQITLPVDDLYLSPDVEQCIYRITQEAVENVVHHAGARNLTARLTRQGKNIELLIQDDGRGFSPGSQQQPGHFGLAGMRERAQLAGGILTIESQPGRGTTIRLEMKDCIQ